VYSSRHALNVSLILNLQTGLVSPQYYCSYDDLFETTTGAQARSIPSQWQFKACLTHEKPKVEKGEETTAEWETSSDEEKYYSSQESEGLKREKYNIEE
jgi:hypothetical protein